MVDVSLQRIEGGVAADFASPAADAGTITLWWLGQAGFAIRANNHRLLIDPYLSDHLARKYAGTPLPHVRLMPAPLTVAQLPPLDAVLCSHAHSDHMDPEALPVLAAAQPHCRFVVPRAERATAVQRGLPPDRTLYVNAGERVVPVPGFTVDVLPSAHEQLRLNAMGEHHYLGFVLTWGGLRLYHSGDAAPFDGWAEQLRAHRIDAALLPVNGRDAWRGSRGIAGNTDFDEARDLCRQAGIGVMICHHFGMFRSVPTGHMGFGNAADADHADF